MMSWYPDIYSEVIRTEMVDYDILQAKVVD
jgi:hypothetical protein